jgi:hypothetical protein
MNISKTSLSAHFPVEGLWLLMRSAEAVEFAIGQYANSMCKFKKWFDGVYGRA